MTFKKNQRKNAPRSDLKNSKRSYLGIQNKGMTYVELIVVLTIFSVISGVTIFDYKKFEHRVEIKDLASHIASKIVEAQKNAQAGRQTSNGVFTTLDSSKKPKPSYGIRFDATDDITKKSFIYFADLDNEGDYDVNVSNACSVLGDECLEKVEIYKGYRIEEIKFYDSSSPDGELCPGMIDITFKRADPNVRFESTSCGISTASEVKITTSLSTSPEIRAIISVHQSGRIQIN
ncbi:MAG: type II secretion system protein [Patescibacteria group bacterium]